LPESATSRPTSFGPKQLVVQDDSVSVATGMPLTNVPLALFKSVSRKRSWSEVIQQWLAETPTSSRQTRFEESRPMDSEPAMRKSELLNGPLSAASLACTVRDLVRIWFAGQPRWKKAIVLRAPGCGHRQNLSERIVGLSAWFVSPVLGPACFRVTAMATLSPFFSVAYTISCARRAALA